MWEFEPSIVDLEVLQTKIVNNQVHLVGEFNRHVNQKYIHFKTDGSKDPITGVTGAAIVVPSQKSEQENIRLLKCTCCWAFCHFDGARMDLNRTLVCRDSVSVLQSLKTGMVKNHQKLVYDVMSIYSRIKDRWWSYIYVGPSTYGYYMGSRGLMDRALDLKPKVTQGCGFESQLWQEVSMTEVRPLSKAPNRNVGCPLLHLDGLNAENTFHCSLYSV